MCCTPYLISGNVVFLTGTCFYRSNLFERPYITVIQINQPTRCNSFTSLLLDVYVWLNMFQAPLRPSSRVYICTRSLWFYRRSVSGWTVAGRESYDDARTCEFQKYITVFGQTLIKLKYIPTISPTIHPKKTCRVGGWLGHLTSQLQTHRLSSTKRHWNIMMKSK
jgi:hypothetical protein